jgi:hypothetical protein
MRILPRDLRAEYLHAKATWPFVTEVNDAHSMPRSLLFAVGSRETNLRNVVGDGGHGHGVFQLDDRSHQIPPGFDQDVRAQAAPTTSPRHAKTPAPLRLAAITAPLP